LVSKKRLAVDGGKPIRKTPLSVMHPGATYYDNEEIRAVTEVLRVKSPYRFYGPRFLNITGRFEKEFAKYLGMQHALAVSSGTAALHTALKGLGVGPGDEVILPTYGWVSCPSAIVAAGATPVLANVDDSLTMDADDVMKRITPRTKAIMAIHIRGSPADVEALGSVATKSGVFLLEDVAQCGGGSFHGRKLGSIGDIGTFSFQLNKMITAGEGGMVVTDDTERYQRSVMFHDCGTPYRGLEEKDLKLGVKPFSGVNYRTNEIASAILRVQLRKLDKIVARTRKNKQRVVKQISGLGGLKLRKENDPAGEVAVALVFFVKTPEKAKAFSKALIAENIRRASGSYPGVVYLEGREDGHVYPHWKHLVPVREDAAGQYRASLDLMARAVHLDISPMDTNEDLDDIAEGIQKVAEALL
jgi:8-amino-3,8-dideoxy-alpha-D-manno-octulosonate transaminase